MPYYECSLIEAEENMLHKIRTTTKKDGMIINPAHIAEIYPSASSDEFVLVTDLQDRNGNNITHYIEKDDLNDFLEELQVTGEFYWDKS